MPDTRPLFALGKAVATPEALKAMTRSGDTPGACLKRHQTGDWGDLCDEDKRLNDEAVEHEGDAERQARVLSAYGLKDQTKIWVITEWDRSSTCILLPSEY